MRLAIATPSWDRSWVGAVCATAASQRLTKTEATDDTSGLVRSARLFDLYKPKDAAGDQRSMAVRLELRDDDTTLTEERIEAATAQAVERAKARLGARLR